MNTKHRISLIDYNKYEHDNELASSYRKDRYKSLIERTRYDNQDVQFIVKENNISVFQTNSLKIAIEKYNELP
jgi:hypothetical protein